MHPRKTDLLDECRCENCAYFFQHYVEYRKDVFRPCYCGHCHKPRIKSVKPDMTCDLFKAREPAPLP